ncbi:hypothetical protein JRO89_XS03G0205000 [Xanthoceras sorbifolium]|uniref:Imidazoleglycerol-phosphate dehydratase n=1 Tax=Xanthoceras sorbifolium TaxID=99658 RepID=A0ABQ8IB84_9ROSI|nr:hypothetical protein JRO89_XS03G0205000 [Xanthoceras sorbifolium]
MDARLLSSSSSSALSSSQLFFKSKLIVPNKPFFSATTPVRFSTLSSSHHMSSQAARASLSSDDNGSTLTSSTFDSGRIGEVKRVTKETNVFVKINLDGSGQLASHGLFDVHVRATGDIHIDDHHTNEDVALAIGTALLQALGDRKGINRFGDFSAPLDEALIHVSLDLSGRPHLNYDLQIPTQRVGTYDTQVLLSFFTSTLHLFQSVVLTTRTLLKFLQRCQLIGGALFPVFGEHFRNDTSHPAEHSVFGWTQLAGKNSHHIIEATFKAFARALRQATEYDPRRLGTIPSSKGVLSRS